VRYVVARVSQQCWSGGHHRGRTVRLTRADGEWLVDVLRRAHISEVAVGCAAGVDTDAEAVLRAAKFHVVRFRARWEEEGRAAGARRN
jgi:hypothetical protein